MSETTLRAVKRDETGRKARDKAFIPGVIYGTGVEGGLPIKFDGLELGKTLKSQGMSPRMAILLEEEKTNVLIKEVQKDPVRGNVIHIDLQAIGAHEVIRTTIPIIFEGREKIEGQHLLLEVYLFEIEVSGPADIIPDSITVNVGQNEAGSTVTVNDIDLDSRITPITPLDEVLAVVAMPKMEVEEEEEEETMDSEEEGSEEESD